MIYSRPFSPQTQALSDYLLEIQTKLSWSEEQMRANLQITEKEWKKIINKESEPSLIALTSFAENLEVDLEKLFYQEVDLDLLIGRIQQNRLDMLPERYSEGCFSRVRTSRALLDYIELYFGWRVRTRILRSLEMNEFSVHDPERLINMNFYRDICIHMKQMGQSDGVLQRMGQFAVNFNKQGVVGGMFKDCDDPQEVYQRLIPVLGKFFERNHQYRILSLSVHHCEIEARPSEEVCDHLKVKKLGSRETCQARKGVAGSFAQYAGPYPTTVRELECMHVDSDRCVFWIEWPSIKLTSTSH